MRPLHRIALLALLVAVAPVIAGCENFDPDKLDVFDLNKEKPLPGERKPLFPNGVPGVSQGIPQEYMRGNQPQTDMALTTQPAANTAASGTAAQPQQTATAAPVEEVKPAPKAASKPKRKASKPKQTVKREAKPEPKAETKTETTTQRAQAPANEATQQVTSPWPSTPASTGTAAPWPTTPPAGSTAPWPTAPPPGTFSK
jgi:hypothetical protein